MTPLGKVRFEEQGGVPVAHLEGEVDLSNVGEITTSILAQIGGAPLGLVTDLSGTAYLDSAGIRMLFELNRGLSREGHDLRVVVPREAPIQDALALTELPQVIPLHPTVEDALAAMERTPDPTGETAG